MKLVSLTLKNFRCFSEITKITFEELTTLIGQNDIGKSTILEALEIFFNNNDLVKIDCYDLSVHADEKKLQIICEFSDLPHEITIDADAKTTFKDEYLLSDNGTLVIKKEYDCNGQKPKEAIYIVASHPSTNQYNDLLELNNSSLKKRLTDLKIDPSTVSLNTNSAIRKAIWNSCEDLQITETDLPVTKDFCKQIWEKVKLYLPVFALFQSDRPSKDSDPEVQNPLKAAIRIALSDPMIIERLEFVTEAVKRRALESANRTQAVLNKISPDLASKLNPDFKANPNWASLFNLSLSCDDGISLNKRGSGVRRLVLVSFFRAEAESRANEKESSNIIYAIEEPETSQHPNNQRLLINSLIELSEIQGTQVVITTHSPGLASLLPINCLRFISLDEKLKPKIFEPSEIIYEKIASSLGIIPDDRVRVLIFVEGPTDVIALKCLSRALNQADDSIIDLNKDDRLAFIVLGGSNLSHWVNQRYLKTLNRSEFHLYDNDKEENKKSVEKINTQGPKCYATLTKKLEIENYLHPDAIREGLNLEIEFFDETDIPKLINKKVGWNPNTTKRKLAEFAFPIMNANRITEIDPNHEIEGWLRKIGELIEQ